MTVRTATTDDVPRIVEMGVRFVADSEFWRIGPASPEKIVKLVLSIIDGGGVFVAEDNGRVIGMLCGCLVDHPMMDSIVASELAWWVEPEHRGTAGARLLAAFAAWAHDRGADVVHMVAPNARVAAHYRKRGLTEMETSFIRRIT